MTDFDGRDGEGWHVGRTTDETMAAQLLGQSVMVEAVTDGLAVDAKRRSVWVLPYPAVAVLMRSVGWRVQPPMKQTVTDDDECITPRLVDLNEEREKFKVENGMNPEEWLEIWDRGGWPQNGKTWTIKYRAMFLRDE